MPLQVCWRVEEPESGRGGRNYGRLRWGDRLHKLQGRKKDLKKGTTSTIINFIKGTRERDFKRISSPKEGGREKDPKGVGALKRTKLWSGSKNITQYYTMGRRVMLRGKRVQSAVSKKDSRCDVENQELNALPSNKEKWGPIRLTLSPRKGTYDWAKEGRRQKLNSGTVFSQVGC